MQDPVQKTVRPAPGERSGGHPESQGLDPVTLQLSGSVIGKLDNISAEINQFAMNVRETDKALGRTSDVVAKLKAQLGKIVKNWPPFTPDSAERKEILMSCVALRKEIEKLTVPPPPKPVYEQDTKLWDKLVSAENGKLSEAMPEISPSAIDEQVRSVLGGLDGLQSSIEAGRNELVRAVTK